MRWHKWLKDVERVELRGVGVGEGGQCSTHLGQDGRPGHKQRPEYGLAPGSGGCNRPKYRREHVRLKENEGRRLCRGIRPRRDVPMLLVILRTYHIVGAYGVHLLSTGHVIPALQHQDKKSGSDSGGSSSRRKQH